MNAFWSGGTLAEHKIQHWDMCCPTFWMCRRQRPEQLYSTELWRDSITSDSRTKIQIPVSDETVRAHIAGNARHLLQQLWDVWNPMDMGTRLDPLCFQSYFCLARLDVIKSKPQKTLWELAAVSGMKVTQVNGRFLSLRMSREKRSIMAYRADPAPACLRHPHHQKCAFNRHHVQLLSCNNCEQKTCERERERASRKNTRYRQRKRKTHTQYKKARKKERNNDSLIE